MRRWLADMKEGTRQMPALLRTTFSVDTWMEMADNWVSRRRELNGQEPDWDVERRIAKRRAEKPPESPS